VLDKLAVVQRGCLAVVALIAIVTLLAWFIPALGQSLPTSWMLMKANTALGLLCGVVSLVLSQPKRSRLQFRISRLLALFIVLMAGSAVVEYVLHISIGVDTLLTADRGSLLPGRMSPQTASALLLLGGVMLSIRMRKRPAARIADLLAFSLSLLILAMASGFVFGALHLFALTATTRTAPSTQLCLMLLAFVAFARRAEYGIFAIFLGVGIGSKIARMACPFALLLPFGLAVARATAIKTSMLSPAYANAIATSSIAMLALGLILILARRIDSLEIGLRDLSLRDGLTKVYNHRGFYVLAEHALQLAQRSGLPFSVLFIDLDNLKQINDTLGHETGSMFLCEVAELLKESLRKSDVVGRIGGDEFAVAGVAGEMGIDLVAQHLEQSVILRNAAPGRQYVLSFSVGRVTSDGSRQESLEDLLVKADKAMYLTKKLKKQAQREQAGIVSPRSEG
jgi:diguanylate cyclase (GGDEF)-like protein